MGLLQEILMAGVFGYFVLGPIALLTLFGILLLLGRD